VVPFTDDKATVEHLLTSLSPEIMPKLGSRPDKALIQAQALMTDAGISEASILMITDGIQEKDIERIRATLPVDTTLSLIAVGTAEGAPISIGEQGFLKLDDGTIVLPRLDTSPMQALYKATGSRWRMLSYDDSDWRALIDGPTFNDADKSQQDTPKDTLEVWQDDGYWLAFLLIPIAILGFRRGVLFSVVLFVIPSLPQPAMAGIWQTNNQEAAALLETDPAQAANLFTDPEWQGAAHYRAGDYEAAADAFAKSDSAEASYNRGNARAMQGQYDQAIDAYRDALKKDPNLKAAQQNLEVVEQALEEQEKQNSQSGDGDNSDKSENSESENNESGESEPGNNESSQNDSQSQDSSEQNSQQGSDQNQSSEQQPDQTAGQDQENSESASGSDRESESADSEQAQSQSQQKQDDEYAEQQANKQETAESEKQAESQSPENGDNIEQSDLKQSDKEPSNTEPSSTNQQQDSDEAPADDSPFQHLSREQQAAMESVLNEVEDNPGLLMQRKFLYQYRQNADQSEEDVLW
jgi:Ca-activated chloride channel family protein